MGKAIVHLMTAALLAGCGETTPFAVTPRLLAEKRAIEGELLFEDQRFHFEIGERELTAVSSLAPPRSVLAFDDQRLTHATKTVLARFPILAHWETPDALSEAIAPAGGFTPPIAAPDLPAEAEQCQVFLSRSSERSWGERPLIEVVIPAAFLERTRRGDGEPLDFPEQLDTCQL